MVRRLRSQRGAAMRITFVLPPLTLSGGIRVLAIYAERLERRGHQVVVVSTAVPALPLRRRVKNLLLGRDESEPEVTYFDGLAIDHRKLSHPAPVTDVDVPDGDVVVATWWATAPAVHALSPSKGKKAYFIQGYEAVVSHQPADQVDATWRLPIQKICVAEWLVDMARDRFADATAVCVPNSVDTSLFFAPPRGKQPITTVGFIYVGVHAKGTDIAIAAVQRAREKIPSLRVICFGAEEPTPELPLPDFVEFVHRPPQPAIRDLYASCDAFLQPTRIDGFGLPILEAMACRTPVIATPAGAAPMLVRQGGGVMVPGDDPAGMASAIERVAAMDEPAWAAMSDAAHRTATSYSWDDATALFESTLARLVGG
jgi:glycosyltransferase involved in cell wall biosynthesis